MVHSILANDLQKLTKNKYDWKRVSAAGVIPHEKKT